MRKCTPLCLSLFVWAGLFFVTTPAICQWERLPGPFGGPVIQFDTDGEYLYANTKGGIYQSPDKGDHWSLLEKTAGIAGQIMEFQVEKGRIFILTTNGEVWRTDDNGLTWKTLFKRPYPLAGPGEKLLKLFVRGDTVLLGSVLSIYRSLDKGDNWESSEVFFKKKFIGFAQIDNDLYAAIDRFIRKSSDGGLSWKTVFSSGYFFAAMTAVDSILYGIYDGYPRLIRSTNGGQSWDKMDSDSIIVGPYAEDYPDWLSATGSEVFYVADYSCAIIVHRSNDKGSHWSKPGIPKELALRTNDLIALPGNLLLASSQGVFRSEDMGTSFTWANQGLNATYVWEIFKTINGQWWTETQSGVFSSDDDGMNWTLQIPAGQPYPCYPFRYLNHTRQRIFVNNDCNIYYRAVTGNSWDTLSLSDPWSCPQIVADEKTAFILTNNNLYKLNDGQSTLVTLNLPHPGFYNMHYDDGVLYLVYYSFLLYSLNEGQDWVAVPAPDGCTIFEWLDSDSTRIYCRIDAYPDEDYIAAWNKTTGSWEHYPLIDPELSDTILPWQISLFYNTGAIRWLGVQGRGLYYASVTDPNKWYSYHPGFPSNSPTAVFLTGNELWVGTAGAGLYRTDLVFKTTNTPAPHFTVYPNPSSGAPIHLSSDQFFTERLFLRIFDATGSLIREQILPPGQFWDIPNASLPSGMYILQVLSGDSTAVLRWVRR